MAYGVVDGRANGFWEALVIQWGRNDLLHIHHVIVTDLINFFGRDTGNDIGCDHFEHFGCESTGHAHDGDFFC